MQYFNLEICRELEKRGLKSTSRGFYLKTLDGNYALEIEGTGEGWDHTYTKKTFDEHQAFNLLDIFEKENLLLLFKKQKHNFKLQAYLESYGSYFMCECGESKINFKITKYCYEFYPYKLLTLYLHEDFKAVEKCITNYLGI